VTFHHLGQFDSGLIRRQQVDHGMVPFPRHGPSLLDHGIHAIEQRPIPMLFQIPQQHSIGVYLTQVGWVISQTL
jgi:hypothetical protein